MHNFDQEARKDDRLCLKGKWDLPSSQAQNVPFDGFSQSTTKRCMEDDDGKHDVFVGIEHHLSSELFLSCG